jgi:hypothetical protein
MAKAKKEKKAEGGFDSYEGAKAVKEDSTSQLKVKREEFRTFLKETGLKKGKDFSKDKKHGKAWDKLNTAVEELEATRKSAIDFMKENKPAKSAGPRATKYVYPDEVNNIKDAKEQSEAKKKHRTKIRAKAKRAGVNVDTYLSDPKAHDAAADSKKAEKKSKKTKAEPKGGKAEKPAKKGKSKKSKAEPEDAPAKPSKKKKKSKKEVD